MAETKPICGSQGETTDDLTKTFLFLWSVVSAGFAIYGKVTDVGLAGVPALSAYAAAVAVFLTVLASYWKNCLTSPGRLKACSAGVINEIVRSFNRVADTIFPFSADHDRIDVVVKCDYWPLVKDNAASIECANDELLSPILIGFYKNDSVCAAGLGAVIGAAAGAIAGILAGLALAALIGCATVILCLIAIIVAALVAAAIVLAGAFLGGNYGRFQSEHGPPQETPQVNVLSVGDYVTTIGDPPGGGLITRPENNGARVYWFITETYTHGRSEGTPQFSHTDPDTNLNDACPTSGRVIL